MKCRHCGDPADRELYEKSYGYICRPCVNEEQRRRWQAEREARAWPDEAIFHGLSETERRVVKDAAGRVADWQDYLTDKANGIDRDKPPSPDDLIESTIATSHRRITLLSRTIQYAIEHGLYQKGHDTKLQSEKYA